jgi:hypothetical protein
MLRIAAEMSGRATARDAGAVYALPATASREHAVAVAEDTAASQLAATAKRMSRIPTEADGVPADVRAALAAGLPQWTAMLQQQIEASERSARLGDRANLLLLLIGAVLVLEALAEVSAAAHERVSH